MGQGFKNINLTQEEKHIFQKCKRHDICSPDGFLTFRTSNIFTEKVMNLCQKYSVPFRF